MAVTNITDDDLALRFEPYEFLETQPGLYIFLITVLVFASVIGTCGNILILIAIGTQRDLQNMESVFIVNLACCDLYVTAIADPLSIVGKTLGWRFFSDFPGFCRAIGSLCTISCVGSLMTLSAMSCNRYVLICHQQHYNKIFTTRNSIIMCFCFFFVGFVLVGLNFIGVGDHSFDHKSLECIWDRMANHNYTIVFAVVMVLIPIFVTGLSYIRLFLYVRKSRLKIHSHGKNNPKAEASVIFSVDQTNLNTNAIDGTVATQKTDLNNGKQEVKQRKKSKPGGGNASSTLKLARALFIIYLVFSACWLPFSLLIVLDADDTFSHEIHVTIVAWAHLHPSMNWLVYYNTHLKFHAAFRKLVGFDKCCL